MVTSALERLGVSIPGWERVGPAPLAAETFEGRNPAHWSSSCCEPCSERSCRDPSRKSWLSSISPLNTGRE